MLQRYGKQSVRQNFPPIKYKGPEFAVFGVPGLRNCTALSFKMKMKDIAPLTRFGRESGDFLMLYFSDLSYF